MSDITVNGKTIALTEDGYLVNASDWSNEIALALAEKDGFSLTDKHFKVLNYLREEFDKGATLTIRKVGKSGIVDIKGLYKLFPGGPLKLSSKYAGIPKPTSCV